MRKTSLFFLIGLFSIGIIPGSCQYGFADGPAPLIATFDSFQEGFGGSTITDGGITLSNLTYYNDEGFNPGFSVEGIGSQYDLGAGFSRPNVLGTFGYGPGPGFGYSIFGAADISFETDGTAAGIDIFSPPWYGPGSGPGYTNVLRLQATYEGNWVAATYVNFEDHVSYHHMEISGVRFDALQLIATGAAYNGAVYILMDNISVTPIPEPATLLLLGLGAVILRRKY